MLTVKAVFKDISKVFQVDESVQYSELATLIRGLFKFSPAYAPKIKYIDDEGDAVHVSSDLELNGVKMLISMSTKKLPRFVISVHALSRNVVFHGLKQNHDVDCPYISLTDEEPLVSISDNVSEHECSSNECSLLLPSSSTVSYLKSEYEEEAASNVNEERVYTFENEEDDEDQAEPVFVKSVATETNDLLFPKEKFVIQKEQVMISNSKLLDTCDFFHPNARYNTLVSAFKSRVEVLMEQRKNQIIDQYFKSLHQEDTVTVYGEAELFDDHVTVFNNEAEDDDNKTLVLDESEQTKYVPKQVCFLPMFSNPISTTLSCRMATQHCSWVPEVDENEWVDVMEMQY